MTAEIMAFLGVASLAGLIISHVIVLFDFIDEKRHEGETLRKAVVYGSVLASYNVEAFSLERMRSLTAADIEHRFNTLLAASHFGETH